MALRIGFSILLLGSVLFAPLYISALLGLVGIFLFPVYVEVAVIFFISDLLYGTEQARFSSIPYLGLFFSSALLLIIESLKKRLRFYQK